MHSTESLRSSSVIYVIKWESDTQQEVGVATWGSKYCVLSISWTLYLPPLRHESVFIKLVFIG